MLLPTPRTPDGGYTLCPKCIILYPEPLGEGSTSPTELTAVTIKVQRPRGLAAASCKAVVGGIFPLKLPVGGRKVPPAFGDNRLGKAGGKVSKSPNVRQAETSDLMNRCT